MSVKTNGGGWPSVGAVVDAYEAVLAREGRADLARFAPAPDHPEQLSILCELVRVDLEHQWRRGHPPMLESYRKLFPEVFEDPELLHAMAFEEFRLRQQAGETPTPVEYRRRFGLDGRVWPLPPAVPARTAGHAKLSGPSDAVGDEPSGMEWASTDRPDARGGPAGSPDGPGLNLDPSVPAAERSEFLRSLDRADPHAAERLASAVTALPQIGTDFLGFRLCGELGKGAFGRVFLARQGDLSDRFVALKVSADVGGETRALAQLQHTNIIPIHSVHRYGPLQAVCMPYLGGTTFKDTLSGLRSQAALPKSGQGLLSTIRSRGPVTPSPHTDTPRAREAGPERVDQGGASPGEGSHRPAMQDRPPPPHVERLCGMGYLQAVLWLMERVADGLAHAHERGILHRDLKPANILFADDGEPILLDFNLAADTKSRLGASLALIGGTLPYMAPEQLRAFRDGEEALDPRSDVYALGVILHELMTGVHPFPVPEGEVDDILPRMIDDRLERLPDIRVANPSISPAMASIVRHCLEPNSRRRYQSARQLQEDLSRQLLDLPLRHVQEPSIRERVGKWARRHPRLSSSTTVGLVSVVLLLSLSSAFLLRSRHYRRVEASSVFHWLGDERRRVIAFLTPPFVDPALTEEGLTHCRKIAERYGMLDDPAWLTRPLVAELPVDDRARLRQDVGDVLVLWAQALIRRAKENKGPDRASDLAGVAERLGLAESCFGPGATPRALMLARADLVPLTRGDAEEERQLRSRVQAIPLRANSDQLLFEDPEQIPADFRQRLTAEQDAIAARDPQDWAVWVALGNWNVRLRRPPAARTAYSVAVALAPKLWAPRYNRGLLYLDLKDNSLALEDFDRVVDLRPDMAVGYLNRALAKLGMGDAKGAADDVTTCLGLKDAPRRAWFIRAEARRRLGDLVGARQDREQGLKLQPDEPAGFVVRGLARLPGDVPGALADFDAALAIEPNNRFALQNKAHVLGELLGQGEEALKVLNTLLTHHPDLVEPLCGRGVQLARYGRRDGALRDAENALALDNCALTDYQVACIHALLAKQDPAESRDALRFLAEALHQDGSWLSIARKDPDLASIRNLPAFESLLRGFEAIPRPSLKHR